MHTITHSKHHQSFVPGIMAVLCAGLIVSIFPQVNVSKADSSHGVVLTAIKCDTLVSQDSTLAIKVFAENKGKNVVEAVVTLVDSASGDTLENWYPLFPPESDDSIVMFWNTKGAKAGSHTLSGILAVFADSTSIVNRLSRTVKVVR